MILALWAGSVAQASATDPSLISTDGGVLQGSSDGGIITFKGVPFAAPPLADLRWRPPQPPAPWPGIRQANQFAPACMQDWADAYPPGSPREATSEDCLYLNIWKSAAPDSGKRPVMVWIYGGGLQNGSGAAPLYAGDQFARKGVIFVTFNYRLGPFGFLAHPDLTRESPHKTSGNYGLLDQIAALRWIQRNIAAFGGDPARVTILGQSSGGDSVSALVTSPLAKTLFSKAVAESGGAFEPLEIRSDLTLAGAEAIGKASAARIGAGSLADLRRAPAEQIMRMRYPFQLIVDGYALPRPPYDTYRLGLANPADLLLGSNADEATLFDIPRTITARDFGPALARDGFPSVLTWLMGVKPGQTDQTARAAAVAFETEMRFGWDMWAWARLAAALPQTRVFYYRFAHTPPFRANEPFFGRGAMHGLEMQYVFAHLDQQPEPWTAQDRDLANAMSAYWTNFASSGDLNGPGLPQWTAFTPADHTAMLFDGGIRQGPVPDEPALYRLDRLYGAVRFVLAHPYFLSLLAILVVATTAVIVWDAFARKGRSSFSRKRSKKLL